MTDTAEKLPVAGFHTASSARQLVKASCFAGLRVPIRISSFAAITLHRASMDPSRVESVAVSWSSRCRRASTKVLGLDAHGTSGAIGIEVGGLNKTRIMYHGMCLLW